MVDQNLTVLYDRNKVEVYKNENVTTKGAPVLQGARDRADWLWYFHIPTQSQLAHLAYQYGTTFPHIRDLISFIHRVFGSPAIPTMQNAIRNNFFEFPGLTLKRFRDNKPLSVYTSAGHMRQRPMNDRINRANIAVADSENYISISSVKSFFDKTGMVGEKYAHKYIFIMYNEKADYRKLISLQDNDGKALQKAYITAENFFTTRGYESTSELSDNETSKELRKYIKSKGKELKLAPPNQHRGNHVERDIQSVKNHLISLIAGVDPDFPLEEWHRCIPQAEHTLALLTPSKHNPTISQYEYFKKKRWNFTNKPMAPFGTRLMAYKTPTNRPSFGIHGELGFYVGPAKDHDKCILVWIIKTGAQRIVETYVWHARTFPTPKPDMTTLMVAALQDVAEGITTRGIEEARKSDRFGSLIEVLKMAQLAPSMDNIVPIETITEL